MGRKVSKTVIDKNESAYAVMEPSEAIDSLSYKQENNENYTSTTKDDYTNSVNQTGDYEVVDKNRGARNDDH